MQNTETGGEAGIRTLDTGFSPYNGLANRRLQPLGHLTAARFLSIRQATSYGNAALTQIVPEIVPASGPEFLRHVAGLPLVAMLLFCQCGSERVDIKMWNVRRAQLHMAVTDMVKAKEFYTGRCENKCWQRRVAQAMRTAKAHGLQEANV
jgi:hypothetical protein